MKSSLSHALFLLLVIAPQSISSTTTGAASAGEKVVKDATGKKVLNNVPYHIGPIISAKGGRIKLTDTMNNKKICPFNVVQDPSDVNLGGQFSFTLIAKEKYLRTSRILGIDSGYPKGACKESTFWTIPDAEGKLPYNLITTGDGFDTDTTCFQLVEYPKPTSPKVHSYMLQHCPSFCGAGPQTCFNVSIYLDKGVRRLASSGSTPFEFVFHKSISNALNSLEFNGVPYHQYPFHSISSSFLPQCIELYIVQWTIYLSINDISFFPLRVQWSLNSKSIELQGDILQW